MAKDAKARSFSESSKPGIAKLDDKSKALKARTTKSKSPIHPRHPNKEVNAVVKALLAAGWAFRKGGGHAWGVFKCSENSKHGCSVSVWSTPATPENHARNLRRAIERCPHGKK